jgi:hypothetical protein
VSVGIVGTTFLSKRRRQQASLNIISDSAPADIRLLRQIFYIKHFMTSSLNICDTLYDILYDTARIFQEADIKKQCKKERFHRIPPLAPVS